MLPDSQPEAWSDYLIIRLTKYFYTTWLNISTPQENLQIYQVHKFLQHETPFQSSTLLVYIYTHTYIQVHMSICTHAYAGTHMDMEYVWTHTMWAFGMPLSTCHCVPKQFWWNWLFNLDSEILNWSFSKTARARDSEPTVERKCFLLRRLFYKKTFFF